MRMRNRYIYYIVLSGLLAVAVVGCRPRGVLSSAKMRDVLYDLHRADGTLQVMGYNYSHDAELAACYQSVLDKHGVTQAEFDSSVVWYTDNPQIFNKIYPRVISRLEADLAAEEALREANQNKVLTPQTSITEEAKAQAAEALEEALRHTLYGLDNPWQLWTPPQSSAPIPALPS